MWVNVGASGVDLREIPIESGLHRLDADGHSLLVGGEASLPATEVLGSATAIMPTSLRSNVRQACKNTRRQASSRHNRKVGIRAGRTPTSGEARGGKKAGAALPDVQSGPPSQEGWVVGGGGAVVTSGVAGLAGLADSAGRGFKS
jgi:hypothetical protein